MLYLIPIIFLKLILIHESVLQDEKHIYEGFKVNLNDYPGKLCNRICKTDETRICYYKFYVQHYQAMGVACKNCAKGVKKDCSNPQCIIADGLEKGVLSINRQIPGPAIHVCKGDNIVVDVSNFATGTAASIHWHGLHMRATPHMDGVPLLTQCPIPFTTTFRYSFYATQAGTQFYHSHSGHQKVSGQYGGLVIREPPGDDPNSKYYDYDLEEHLIVISDWMHECPEMFVPGLPTRSPGISPDSVLINGRGQYIDSSTKNRTNVPPSKFYVEKGKRYRFRLVNSGSFSCPIQFQIEGHNMSVIATDSYNVKPKKFTTLVTNAGERYDFIVTAKQSIKNYLIRVRALGLCSSRPTESFALLVYKNYVKEIEKDRSEIWTETDSESEFESESGKTETKHLPIIYPAYDETFPNGIFLNNPKSSCTDLSDDEYCISELSSTEPIDENLRFSVPDQTIYLSFSIRSVSNEDVFQKGVNNYHAFLNFGGNSTNVGTINRISHMFPSFPLLTQPQNLHKVDFCEMSKMAKHCVNYTICPCIHRIKIKLGSIVEFVIVDESPTAGPVHHPFHIHGYRYWVVGMGNHPLGIPMTIDLARRMNQNRALPRLLFNPNPPYKDTVSIPSRGYSILRILADNPGFWLTHCHYEWHMQAGMAVILQVGEPEDMVKPPSNFPQCGDFKPNIYN